MISKESFTGNNRGVSPVIGVILMVAVTVVLAAVIGASVLDVGNNVGESPSAAVDYNGGDTMTVVSAPNADSVTVTGANGSGGEISQTADTEPIAGTQLDVSGVADGEQLTVTATLNGDTQVIQTFTKTAE